MDTTLYQFITGGLGVKWNLEWVWIELFVVALKIFGRFIWLLMLTLVSLRQSALFP